MPPVTINQLSNKNLALLMMLMIIIAQLIACTPKKTTQTKTTQIQTDTQRKPIKNTPKNNPKILIDDGIIYIRRQANNQLIEMVLNANNPKLDLEIELDPLEPKSDALPSGNEVNNSGEIASSYFINAQGYFLNREYQRALVEIDRAIKENPKSSVSWALKGSIHYRRNENGLAKKAWQRALKLNPDANRVREMLKIIDQ